MTLKFGWKVFSIVLTLMLLNLPVHVTAQTPQIKKWCVVEPNSSQFGWRKLTPHLAIRIEGPESLDWRPDSGEEFYIYYDDEYVAEGALTSPSYRNGIMEWRVNPRWALLHPMWLIDSNWRIEYTISSNTCPFTKYSVE